jgi:serine/threonine-protein kinase HipA
MNAAWVHIWGKRVGAVAWDDARKLGVFEYDPEFLRTGWDIAPFTMPRNTGTFAFPSLRARDSAPFDTFKGLPGLLADALPDRFGAALIEAWLALQGRPTNSLNPVELLCFIGQRGMGALEFEPSTVRDKSGSMPLDVNQLVEIAQQLLEKKQKFQTQLYPNTHKALTDILKIGTSAGGARPKAVIAFNPQTGEVRSGQSDAPEGFEHWLLKLDGVSDIQLGQTSGYGRVEMAYYAMATDAGIRMMPSRLLEENGRAHFMTQRFDREPSQVRHHVQTWCAMKHFDFNEVDRFSYEQLFQTMRELRLPYSDAEQMFRRMAFNVMARNCDDHTKNFAFLLRKGGNWELAPAYDLCHAYRPDSLWVSQHALSVNGKRQAITRDDLLTVAQSIGFRKAKEALDRIREIIVKWPDYAQSFQVNSELIQAIQQTVLPL